MYKRILNIAFALLLLVGAATIGVGCSTHEKTVRTTETVYPERAYDEPAVVERQKTETTVEEGNDSGGVLSDTVNVIGDIIALPFRLVGGLISAIF